MILSYEQEKNQSQKRIPKDILRTKKGLASGAALSSGSFYKRNIQYDDKDNRIEDVLTPFDRPFYDLCRDDLWILDPLSLTVTTFLIHSFYRMSKFLTPLTYYLYILTVFNLI